MDLQLLPLTPADLPQFKNDLQEAFQKAAAAEFKNLTATVLPEADIDKSLNAPGAAAYKAVSGGKMIGGAIVNINAATQHNHLDLLYVKCGTQSRGTGIAIWQMLEKMYPDTIEWETCTPYFEKRNIHFYINRCGFSAVEFFNPHHPDPTITPDLVGGDYFFRFVKKMK